MYLGTLGGTLIGTLNPITIYNPYIVTHKLQGSLLGVPPKVLRVYQNGPKDFHNGPVLGFRLQRFRGLIVES